ncbi:MAG TPA: AAA domain-containing protein [Frankiaceae bacterium]|nr:AAA domain-containing protein [Frankiaceae bacterium]
MQLPDPAPRARAALLALADLVPSGDRGDAIPLAQEHLSWLPQTALTLFGPDEGPRTPLDAAAAERLAAIDQVRADGNALRAGWVFVTGRTTVGGRTRKVMQPLVTVPVRVRRGPIIRPWLDAVGDVELSPLIPDGDERRRLEEALDLTAPAWTPELHEWAVAAARAAGLEVAEALLPQTRPDRYRGPGLAVSPAVGVYALRDAVPSRRGISLREWATRQRLEETAFAAVYGGLDTSVPMPPRFYESPFALNASQRRAVEASRSAGVSVVSGAPGTGKSQTVVAIACDALARGETVLVAARTDAAVDALLDLLDRGAGPEPVVFGSSERRQALAQRLAGGVFGVSRREVNSASYARDTIARQRDDLRGALADRLYAHLLVVGDERLTAMRDKAPGLFGPGADLAAYDRLFQRAQRARWRRKRREAKVREAAGAAPDTPLDELAAVRRLAGLADAAAAEVGGAPLPPTGDYAAVVAMDEVVRAHAGRWHAALAHSDARLDARARASVAALATALRSSRGPRRQQLARLDRTLTKALPVWVGSLPDIDDLLPPVAALFDLVVLDEASSIDQALAAPALLRARRAVVVGDPKQLRHVSFLGDEELGSTLAGHGVEADPLLAALLDVRRNSAFDVAAAVAPVLNLDEHHRSRPHLVELVAKQVYGGTFAVARRSPVTESVDCIHAERLDGRRAAHGVVPAEVDRVVELLRERLAAGVPSVGVLTPFRAQADALEAAVLRAFTADELAALNLRVGTVHAFQGNERDDVIVSLGVAPGEKAASWRFVEDRHLFAVLTTRARMETTVLHSADPPERGLLAAYLAQANHPPGRPRDRAVSRWGMALAAELRRAGADVVTGYEAGRHVVDVCWYGLARPRALVTDVHPGGVAAHIERAEALVRYGWEVVEALQRPMATPERVVVELLARVG